MRILYVEDNQANVYLVKRVAIGHEVINYIDGEEALAKITNHDPDLILMDIQLAGPMTGLDVVKTLRGRGVETPIIAVTAYAMVGDRERCLAAGCDDYLAKPLPITRLIGLIKKFSELTESKQQSDNVVAAETPTSDSVEKAESTTEEKSDVEAISKATEADKKEEAAIREDIKDAPRSDITGEALIIDVAAETTGNVSADAENSDAEPHPATEDDTTATTSN